MTDVKTAGELAALTEHVLHQARKSAEQIVARARQEAEKIISQAEEQAKVREEELVHAGMEEVTRLRRQIVSQAQLRLKEELLREKAEILGRIVGEIRDRLTTMCAKDGKEYLDVLVGLVEAAISGEEKLPKRLILHLSPQDIARYEKELPTAITARTGVKQVELVPEPIRGGVIVEIPESHVEVDSSVSRLLQEFTPKVEALVTREIFAPLNGGGE